MTVPKSYSDAIDEINVPEVDDSKSEYHAAELINDPSKSKKRKIAQTPQAAIQFVMPDWQRQAIMNSLNCSSQQMLMQNLYSQQCCNIRQNLQSQLTNSMQTLNGTLSHSLEDMNEGLQAIWVMLDKIKRGL